MAYNSPAYRIGEAFNPADSVFVSANAGAGKTSLLTNRVLALLLHGVEPSKILCLTFTNAAAAEMANRILKHLGQWVMANDIELAHKLQELTDHVPDARALARARSLFAGVLEAPEGVRIQTIHGFCQSLLRRFPIEANISPHFSIIDSRTEQELMQEARLRLFGRAQNEDPSLQLALHAIAQSLGETEFQKLVTEIIKSKRSISSLFSRHNGVEQAVDDVWKLLNIPKGCTMQDLVQAHFQYTRDELAQLRAIAGCLLQSDASTDQKTGKGLAAWLEEPDARDLMAEQYVDVFIAGSTGEPRKTIFTKKCLTTQPEIDALIGEQQRVLRFKNSYAAFRIAQRTTHMLRIADALLTLYRQLKDAYALMDYDDQIMTARALLRRGDVIPWVLYKLDGGIDHILVDEAQDTSPEQWEIIEALTQEFFAGEGRTDKERSLFIVGDEKQSIFSFQGANPCELGRRQQYFSQRISDAAGHSHTIGLTHSYRSTPEVLAAVDAVFAQTHARTGLTFTDTVLTHSTKREKEPGLVEVWPLLVPSDDPEAPETNEPHHEIRLARLLADTIAGWLQQGMILEAKGRPIEAGDIMILVRHRGTLVDRLVRAMKKRNVPVAGLDRMELEENLAVQDLVALAQCVLLPDDDLSLASLLKSPLFGLNEEELFTLCWQRERQSLWERLRAMSGDRPTYQQAYALLSDLRARVDYISPYEFYSYVLDRHGMRSRFTGRMGVEYNDPIDEFLSQALLFERSHIPSMQGFLHWLNVSRSEIKRDMEQAKACVRILTVHGAKGLQAPVVIMPDTVKPPEMRDAFLWHEQGDELLPFWPGGGKRDDLFCAGVRRAQHQEQMAEFRRLLYVAMTRAEDMLVVCGARGKNSLNEASWYHLVWGGLQPLAQPADFPHGKGLRLGNIPAYGISAKPPAAASGQPVSFAFLNQPLPIEPEPPQPLVPSRLTGEEPAPVSPLAASGIYARGRLIHQLLQYLPQVTPGQWDEVARNIADSHAQAMPREMVEQAIAEVIRVMEAPEFAFLFGPGSLAEVPVAGMVAIAGRKVTVSGQIDRLYIGEKEVWIVDFKSNHQSPAPGVPIPLAYMRQMRLYHLLIQQVYPDKKVHCALLWTSAAAISLIDESLLDEVPVSSYI
jgi:ATP-dependent helicase/nuclease subunit A